MTGAKRTTLATIANVAALMDEAGIRARYNVIKKQVEIELPGHQGTPDNLDNVTLSGVTSLCARHSMPIGSVGEYVNAIADRNAYNPVADWIDNAEWDGRDRLPDLFDTVREQADYPEELKHVLLHKWGRSAAAAALLPGYKGRGVLTLQGSQGIGKTSWVKALVSDAALRDSVVKLDHHLDGGNKDSVLIAIANWIVEIGELDSSFKKDVARLKGFLTADSDRVRRPYDRRTSVFDRRTVFVATVNETNFLVDPTGNSRWWTIAVEGLNFSHCIDTQQLFAQLGAEVRAGEPWWLNPKEERQLAEWNSRHTAVSVVVDRVTGWIDQTANSTKRFTPSDLLRLVGYDNPTNPQARECGALLRTLFGPPSRVQGRDTWLVPVREPTAADYDVPRKKAPTGQVNAPGEVF